MKPHGKRKSDLLTEIERALFWEMFNQYFVDLELSYLRWQNRRSARALEKKGML